MFQRQNTRCVGSTYGHTQPADLQLIFTLATALTSVWLYLWYLHPTRPMRSKVTQTHWQLGAYVVITTFGISVMHMQGMLDILLQPTDMYTYPSFDPAYTTEYRLSRLFFEVEVAWYLSSLVCTLVNRNTSDFYAMLFHHIVTPLEILYGWNSGLHSIGLGVMVLHDISDVALHLAKTFKFLKIDAWTDRIFALFVVVFFITRLVCLPIYGLSGIQWYHPHGSNQVVHSILIHGLFVFTALHIYWFTLIVKMAIKAIKAGNVEGDIREVSESTSSETQPKTGKALKQNGANGTSNGINGHKANGVNGHAKENGHATTNGHMNGKHAVSG